MAFAENPKPLKEPEGGKKDAWTDETKIKNDGKRKIWKSRETTQDPKHITSSIKHGGSNVMACIDDVTSDGCRRMTCEV